MYVGKDGHVAGSVDVAVLQQLHEETDDPELKAHYASLVSAETYAEWLGQSPHVYGEGETPVLVLELEPEPERPADYAPKADWIAYAVSKGAEEADASAATKADLIELYGG